MEVNKMRCLILFLVFLMVSATSPEVTSIADHIEDPAPPASLGGVWDDSPSGGLYGIISYDDVVVVYNVNSEVSCAIMENFTRRRGIPPDRVVGVDVPERESIDRDTFNTLRTQVESALQDRKLTQKINYIVTTKGVPLRVWGPGSSGSASVDSELALILGPYAGYIGGAYWIQNPYYGENERFSREKYGFYLVTRLTGYNLSDTLSLIERAERSGGKRGIFLLDVDPGKGGGYAAGNRWLRDANSTLRSMGFETYLDETTTFITDFENCSGYASWGSNDGHYSTTWNKNQGFEEGLNHWEFAGEGEVMLNTSYPYRGGRCLEVKKNTTGDFIIAQNVSVRGSIAYYISGHVNMTGGVVHFTAEVFTSSGALLLREKGGTVSGFTSGWALLRQLPLKPLPPTASKLRIVINISGKGEFYFDEIRLLEVKPHNTWIPGAIAETYVSSSGRTFTWPPYYGQSAIADLIREGVSGVKGYVYEPYLSAMAEPDILFPRYVSGYTMGESYYMASPFLSWRGVVVGDPKMCPYGLQAEITSSTVLKEVVNPGEEVRIAVNVTNIGFGDIRDLPLTLHLEEAGLPDLNAVINISQGQQVVVWFNFSAPTPGTYRVRLVLNEEETIPFMSSSGAEAEVTFRVNSLPEVLWMSSSSPYVRRGCNVLLSAEVRDVDDGLLPLTFSSWIIGPGGVNATLEMSLENSTLSATFTPPLSWDIGFASLHLVVRDPWGGCVHDTLNDAFFVLNNPPGVSNISWTTEVRRGSLFTLNLTLNDPDTPAHMLEVSSYLERNEERVELEERREGGEVTFTSLIPASIKTGLYDIHLILEDGINSTELLYPKAVDVLNSPPSIKLLSSPPNVLVRGEVVKLDVLGEDLEDPKGLLELRMEVGEGVEVSAERPLPGRWEVSLEAIRNAPLGPTELTIWVEDSEGGSSFPLILTFELINAPPEVRIISFELTSPGNKGDLLSTLNAVIEATDPDSGEGVELILNFTGESPFTVNLGRVNGRAHFKMIIWGNLTPGGWMMRATVVDSDGGVNSTEWITFVVVNSPPQILSAEAIASDEGASLTLHIVDPDLPPGHSLTLQVLSGEKLIFEGLVGMGEVTVELNLSSPVESLTLNVSDGYSYSTLTIPVIRPAENATLEGREEGGGVLPVALALAGAASGVLIAAYIYRQKRRGSVQR